MSKKIWQSSKRELKQKIWKENRKVLKKKILLPERNAVPTINMADGLLPGKIICYLYRNVNILFIDEIRDWFMVII